jgi:thymidylate synthase (FAD)
MEVKVLDKIEPTKYINNDFIQYVFEIKGISRAVLMELTRHRCFSFSVKSTRYTLKKDLKNEESFIEPLGAFESIKHYDRASKYVKLTDDNDVNEEILKNLERLRVLVKQNKSNDVIKYALPESFLTDLTMSGSLSCIENFLKLRLSKAALPEIRELANKILEIIPEKHKNKLNIKE